MWFAAINSFADAAQRYASTKPVVSTRHTREQDVRPLGDRRRKWERIIKISDECYVLSHGGMYDPVFTWGYTQQLEAYPLALQDIPRYAPVVWRKTADGTETITIRNGVGDWQHNATYSFLQRALPRNLSFLQGRDGLQHIRAAYGDTYYLPKGRTVPRYVLEYHKNRPGLWGKHYTLEDDGASLTFRREADGLFVPVGATPKKHAKRTRVELDLKEIYKEHIRAFRTEVLDLYPVMRLTFSTYEAQQALWKGLIEKAKEHKLEGFERSWGDMFKYADAEAVRAILADPDHVLRYEFTAAAIMAMRGAELYGDQGDTPETQTARAKAELMKWLNRVAGFVSRKVVEV